jgi:DNA-binding PadR family transcriptional regulator
MGKQSEPLTESYFYILMCLYGGDNHGYGIMQMTEKLSDGKVKIGSGTMYGATGNMLKKGWIIECPGLGGERRRMYRLTQEGREVFLEEYRRISALARSAEKVINEADNT